jgi:polyketide biosynthesis enoyl-CoA hydratase PksI
MTMQNVVQLIKEHAVGRVIMQDRSAKNTFSPQLIEGLMAVFEEIQRDESIKVVIIHGYDTYFCCGGTKEELLGIYQGNVKFTDLVFYDLLLKCDVPVIAAMQGHGLGGGLVFGSYADLLVLGEECIYSANFMKYGFTPGLGGTYIIPRKFGEILGREMLMTAKTYYGREIRERAGAIRVVPKVDVIEAANRLAADLVEKPRLSLVTLKKFLNRDICRELPGVIEAELEMHRKTFAQPEVRERIEKLF